jgi:hypothetical protein
MDEWESLLDLEAKELGWPPFDHTELINTTER